MNRTITRGRSRPRTATASLCIGAFAAIGAALSCAAMAQQQCPTNQYVCSTQTPTGMVRVVGVPGNAGGLGSGVFMRPGFVYRMTAVGSIRVGVFGETGTPPDGWVPQGPAGPGFPAPDSYTFSLLYRVGPVGQWQLLGSGLSVAKLGPHDPAGTQLIFGINDNKLSDNSGAFLVTVTEFALGTKCCPKLPPPPMGGGFGSSTSGGSQPSPQPHLPCAGKTPDGRYQSFQFPMYCGSSFSRNIPVEACTRADAYTQAQALVKSEGINCYLTSN